MSVPRIFVAGFRRDAEDWFRREQLQQRPQALRMVFCSEPHHVKGHLLRRRDRVKILHGAKREVIAELRLLEIRRENALAGLATYYAALARTRFWHFRERRRIRERINKIEQEVG